MTAQTFAQGSRSQLLYKLQTDFTTNASGNFTKARYNGHSLDLARGAVESGEIRSDREVEDFRLAQAAAKGDISVDLCYTDHDWILQSAMFNTFTGSVLNLGVTPQYYTLEDGQLDINQYRLYTGMTVSRFSLDLKPNQIVKVSASLVGQQVAQSGSTGGGTAIAAGTTKPFDTFNASIYSVGGATGITSTAKLAIVSSMTLNIDNGIGPTQQIGYEFPQAIQFGRGRVTGNLVLYYTDATFLNYFLNETETALDINIVDPSGNVLNFGMPRVKITSAPVPVSSEQSRMISCSFVALRELITTGYALTITK